MGVIKALSKSGIPYVHPFSICCLWYQCILSAVYPYLPLETSEFFTASCAERRQFRFQIPSDLNMDKSGAIKSLARRLHLGFVLVSDMQHRPTEGEDIQVF
jgi:hypothetical protein